MYKLAYITNKHLLVANCVAVYSSLKSHYAYSCKILN